jgi:hypothetical protein
VEQVREQQHVQGDHGWIRSRFDLAVAFLLGLTVIAIAWGAYQAELKSKDADHYFNRSDETIGTAHKLELQGDQEVSTYEQLFLQLEQDKAEGRVKAAAYLRRRLITPDLMGAITWWEREPAATRPPSPFVNPNPEYHNVYYERSSTLYGLSAGYLHKAHQAEEHEIDFTIVTVLLTVALFLLGLSTQILQPWVKIGLVVFGAVIMLGSVGRFIHLAVS